MAKTMAKGTGMRASRDSIMKTHGPALWESCLGEVAPEIRPAFANPNPAAWLPIQGMEQVWNALARRCYGGDRTRVDPAFRDMGRYIAEDNLTTVYKVVLAITSADQMIKLLPRLWKTYFDGIDAVIEKGEPGHGTCIVTGMQELTHVAPAACGWLELAYRRVGATECKVRERGYAAGVKNQADVYELEWR